MTAAEIAAYIGAAAWLPQIIAWIHAALVTPKLSVRPDHQVEIGFTSFGPIFNLRMALIVENRDLVIDDFVLELKHQDGECRTFRWAGLQETFSEITDTAGNKQIVSKDQTPIAVKVSVPSLVEKVFRFQEPRFRATDNQVVLDLVDHFNHMKATRPGTFVDETLASKQHHDVIKSRQDWFCWKPGAYTVTVKPASPSSFTLVQSQFWFMLTRVDTDLLRRNIPLIEQDLNDTVASNREGFVRNSITWQWVYPAILRESPLAS